MAKAEDTAIGIPERLLLSEPYCIASALVDEAWVLVQCIEPGAYQERLLQKTLAQRHDSGVVGHQRDASSGQRFMSFPDSLALSSQPAAPTMPVDGVRATFVFRLALGSAISDFGQHHLGMARKSGLSAALVACRSRIRISEALATLHQIDQLSLPALKNIVVWVCLMARMETALSRSRRCPVIQDLEAITGSAVCDRGALILPSFICYVAQLQRDDAFPFNQRRQWMEDRSSLIRAEVSSQSQGGPAANDDGSGGGCGDERGGGRARTQRRRGRDASGRGAGGGQGPAAAVE